MSNLRRFRAVLLFFVVWGTAGCAALKTGIEYEQALQAFQNCHYDVAEGHLNSFLSKNPGEEKAISLMGWIRFKQENITESERLFKEAFLRNPENVTTIEGIGWVDYLRGRDQDAERGFRKLIAYGEKHFQHPYWAEYPLKDRKFIESIYSEANYALGLIAKRRGMWREGRICFEKALSHQGSFIDRRTIVRELADTLFQMGEDRAAAVFYKELLAQDPQDLFLLNRTAWCLYQMGNIDDAKTLYLRSKGLSSLTAAYYQESLGGQTITWRLHAKTIAESYYGLALIYAKEERLDAALEELAMALKISPFFHHPAEVALLLRQNPGWQEALRRRALGRPFP